MGRNDRRVGHSSGAVGLGRIECRPWLSRVSASESGGDYVAAGAFESFATVLGTGPALLHTYHDDHADRAAMSPMNLSNRAARCAIAAALLWLVSLHGVASAQTDTANGPSVEVAATRVVAGVGLARYVSDEPDPQGGVFNHEQGQLRRATLELRHTTSTWQLVAALRQASGVVDYTGQTQLGLPLSTQTDLSRRELAMAAEHQWQPEWDGPHIHAGSGHRVAQNGARHSCHADLQCAHRNPAFTALDVAHGHPVQHRTGRHAAAAGRQPSVAQAVAPDVGRRHSRAGGAL